MLLSEIATAELPIPVTASKSGSGTGTITSTPAGIDCGTNCKADFAFNSTVTLVATPAAGSIFSGWLGGGCYGTGECLRQYIQQPISTTAVFSTGQVVLTTVIVPVFASGGVITSSPGEINCGSVCRYAYPQGTVVTLTATPGFASSLSSWSGVGTSCPVSDPCTVTLDSDMTVAASFSIKPFNVNVVRAGAGTGRVTSVSGTIDCGDMCSSNFTYLVPPALQATPIGASVFGGWSGGGCSGTGTCYPFTNTDSIITATFDAVPPSAPQPPMIVNAIAGDGRVTIQFNPPVNDNGSFVSRYDVSCDAGGFTASGSRSPITVNGLSNGMGYACVLTATNAIGTSLPSAPVNVTPNANVLAMLVQAVSRKRHGAAATHDLPLSIGLPPSVEPRGIGAFHEIVLEFNKPITSLGFASVTARDRQSSLPPPAIETSFAGFFVTLRLRDIPDAARAEVGLSVNAEVSYNLAFRFLMGDVNRSNRVSASDIAASKARRGAPVNAQNFVFDVDLSGILDDQDVRVIKARAGMAAP